MTQAISAHLEYARSPGDGAGNRGLHWLALASLAATFVLIVAGGNVTSKDAGLAVPDWPLSLGSVNPAGWTSMPGVRDEHAHRLIGAAVGLLVTALTVGVWWRDRRRSVRLLATVAWVSVVIQGIMGGLRVTELSLTLAVVHGCFAHAFLCMLVALVAVMSPAWYQRERQPEAVDRRLRFWAPVLVGALFGQLVLGAILRHTGTGTTLHILGAMFVGLFLVQMLSRVFSRRPPESLVRWWSLVALLLFVLQLALGLCTLLVVDSRLSYTPLKPLAPYLPTAHVAVGALILGAVFHVTLWVYRQTASGRPTVQATAEATA